MRGRILTFACAAMTACVSAPAPSSTPIPVTDQGPCGFNSITMSFRGDALQQARCLLRHVRPGGELDEPADLPAALSSRVGQSVNITRAQLQAYLAAQHIAEADVGGSINDPISRTEAGLPALYFVIHDTSDPNLLDAPFPPNMDQASWTPNDISVWQRGDASVAHAFVNRLGQSVTTVEFSRGWRATKLESRIVGAASRGRFIHIENVQPRRSLAGGPPGNDVVAPDPGFTDAQLRRLALLYVVASVRAGLWLIPAQHCVMDSGIADGHDDPQNFDLARWAAFVGETASAIARETPQ